MFELTGKVALITGARRGMGKTHAETLAKQGATVIVTDIDCPECEVVAESISAAGGTAAAYEMDVAKPEDIDRVITDVVEKFGRLDILVNNAGIYQAKPFLDISKEEWDRLIAIDLSGVFHCAQRAAREMAKNDWGRIINIASISSGGVGVGVAASVHYTAAKGGVVGMTEAMAVDLAPMGILVNAIAPGAIDTPMIGDAKLSKDAMDAMMSGVPLRRIGKAEEVSAVVAFLASEEASYVTGSTVYVDGGWLAA